MGRAHSEKPSRSLDALSKSNEKEGRAEGGAAWAFCSSRSAPPDRPTYLDEALPGLGDGGVDNFGGLGLALGPDHGGLAHLVGLDDEPLLPLRLLLGHLLGLDSRRELPAKRQVLFFFKAGEGCRQVATAIESNKSDTKSTQRGEGGDRLLSPPPNPTQKSPSLLSKVVTSGKKLARRERPSVLKHGMCVRRGPRLSSLLYRDGDVHEVDTEGARALLELRPHLARDLGALREQLLFKESNVSLG